MTNTIKNWQKVKIQDVCKVASGATPRTAEPSYWNGEVSWITPMDLSKINSKYIENGARSITKEGLGSCSAEVLPPKSLIMSSRAPIGYFAINTKQATTNQGCKTFVCNDSVDVEFLYYYLSQHLDEIKRLGSGSTFAEVGKNHLENLVIELPSMPTQKRIGFFFNEIDGFIAKTDQIIQKTEVLKQGLMQTIFSKKSISKWEALFLPEISRNLDNKRIPITRTVRTDGKYPYYGATGIVDYVSNFIFDGNYLLISEDGANLKDRNYPIAFSIIGKNWVNNHAHVLEFSDSVLQEFVKHYFNFINLEKYLTGMAQPKLNQEKLNQIPVPKPKDSELQQYVSLLNTLDQKRQAELFRKEKLLELKRGLMQDIFSQKVQIN